MNYTRLYASSDGNTHFETVEIDLKDRGEIGYISDHFEVEKMMFRENPADYDYDFHCAPARQFIIMLNGHLEVITSLGASRTFRGGDILLVEDTEGKGHRSRHLSKEIRKSIFITLK